MSTWYNFDNLIHRIILILYVYLYTDIGRLSPPLQAGTVTGSNHTGEEKGAQVCAG
jgi:hypothetical protein